MNVVIGNNVTYQKSSYFSLKIYIKILKISFSKRMFLKYDSSIILKKKKLPAGNPMTLNIRSSWSWWKGLLVFISSWRQWKIGSEVNSSANMQPIAHISMKEEKQLFVHIYYISLVIISWYNHNLHIKIFFKVGRWMK